MPNMQLVSTNAFHKPFLLVFIFVNELYKENYAATFSEKFYSRKKIYFSR